MGYNVSYENDDSIQIYLDEITKDAEKAEKEMLQEAGDELKKYAIAELNRHKRVLNNRTRIALADDVKRAIKTDKYGNKYVSVGGGKKTGTLWHIVNDGNLHSMPTHFMDGALARMDGNIDRLWDKILR